MNLAAVLMTVLFATHYMPDIIESLYATEQRTAAGKAWEYILTNAGFCVVLAVVGVLVRRPVVAAVCAWGFVESGERVVCRLAKPIGGAPPVADTFSGLCGPSWYVGGLAAALVLAWVINRENKKCRSPT